MAKIEIERPDGDKLLSMHVDKWSEWTCEPSEFEWEYIDEEMAFVRKGKALITEAGGEDVEIKAGDLVTFPKGLKCHWKVTEPFNKVYSGG
ncbi:cupin domain-containing protein [Candidatus Margulisiibacteriota bacterium]